MNKALLVALTLGSLLFFGCAEKDITKDTNVEASKVSKDVYDIVIAKSIKECKEHNIILHEERTNDFMRRSPKQTIEKAAEEERKTPKKLCQFFAEETSLEKVEHIGMFTTKIMKSCEKVGVSLSEKAINKKVRTLPFFVIRQGLSLNKDTSVEECELMQKKYE